MGDTVVHVAPAVVAKLAAAVALRTPGVAALRPGRWAALGARAVALRAVRPAGEVPVAGVRAVVRADAVASVELDVVVACGAHLMAVAIEVQERVDRVVVAGTGLATTVTVNVVDVASPNPDGSGDSR